MFEAKKRKVNQTIFTVIKIKAVENSNLNDM